MVTHKRSFPSEICFCFQFLLFFLSLILAKCLFCHFSIRFHILVSSNFSTSCPCSAYGCKQTCLCLWLVIFSRFSLRKPDLFSSVLCLWYRLYYMSFIRIEHFQKPAWKHFPIQFYVFSLQSLLIYYVFKTFIRIYHDDCYCFRHCSFSIHYMQLSRVQQLSCIKYNIPHDAVRILSTRLWIASFMTFYDSLHFRLYKSCKSNCVGK